MVWVLTAFLIAAVTALGVLLALGAIWVGDELRAAAPDDPLLVKGAPIFGLVLFTGTVGPALTALPALITVITGEALRIRSWIYYVPAGGAALAVIPILGASPSADISAIIGSHAMTLFAAAGFAGGFIYWLLAGMRA